MAEHDVWKVNGGVGGCVGWFNNVDHVCLCQVHASGGCNDIDLHQPIIYDVVCRMFPRSSLIDSKNNF